MPLETLVQLETGATIPNRALSTSGTPLPQHLHNQVRLNWYLTQWCNYSCAYCPVLVFHKKSSEGPAQPHAFDYYPVERWVELFDRFNHQSLHLHMTGGEVFLDRKNFPILLANVTPRKNVTVCVATNAFWDPAPYRDLDLSRTSLDIGFHPTQTSVDDLIRRLRKIREAGFTIAIVNYVMSPENMDAFPENFRKLTAEGLFVQVSAMFPTGVYLTRDSRTRREMELLVRHNSPLDLKYKVLTPDVRGAECFYPSMGYYMLWDGRVQLNCLDTFQNVFEDGFPELPRHAVKCPHSQCIGCTDMYRALVDEPLNPHGTKLFTHLDLAREVHDYRVNVRAGQSAEQIDAEVEMYLAHFARLQHEAESKWPRIPENSKPLPLAENQPLFGYVDKDGENFFSTARSSGRFIIGGWVAFAKQGAPLQEVRLRVGDRNVATIREFYPRPDVATHFQRADWLMSGWRSMVYLPVLPRGQHELIVEAVDATGQSASLPPWPLHIT